MSSNRFAWPEKAPDPEADGANRRENADNHQPDNYCVFDGFQTPLIIDQPAELLNDNVRGRVNTCDAHYGPSLAITMVEVRFSGLGMNGRPSPILGLLLAPEYFTLTVTVICDPGA